MKTIMTVAMTMIAMAMNAGGLYLVSGGDFRRCDAYWKVRTDVPNQEVVVTPTIQQGYYWVDGKGGTSASIKLENGVEYNLNTDALPRPNRTISPISYTFANPGMHIIKLYDPKHTVLYLKWSGVNDQANPSNTNLVEFKTIDYCYSGAVKVESNTCCGYWGLKKAVIPEGVEVLGYLAYSLCKNLEEVHLPSSCTNFGQAFWRDTSLKSINIPESTPSIGSLFCDSSAVTNIVFPAACSNMQAFANCSKLEEVTILNKNMTLGINGFKDCNRIAVVNYAGTLEEWNANESLTGRFGTATATEFGNKATLSIRSATLNYNYAN